MMLEEPALLVGDGALRYQEVFSSIRRVEMAEQGLANPSARSLVQLAHALALREEFVQSWDIKPIYLRQPDAEPKVLFRRLLDVQRHARRAP